MVSLWEYYEVIDYRNYRKYVWSKLKKFKYTKNIILKRNDLII